MKSSVLVLIGIVAILIVGGAFAVTFMNQIADVADGGDSGTFHPKGFTKANNLSTNRDYLISAVVY